MTFNAVANKIIKDSILSSVYIDDNIIEPFEDIADDKKFFNVSKGLYNSFKNENKSIDFYKFKPGNQWQNNLEYLFKNRDLLILDWDLSNNNQIKQTETIKIIKQAVETDNLHFISIYTETPIHSFQDIFYFIKASFDVDFNSSSTEHFTNIIDTLDAEGIETDNFKKLTGKFKDLSLKTNVDALTILDEEIKVILESDKLYSIFRRLLKPINKDNSKACEIFGYLLNGEKSIDDKEFAYNLNFDFAKDNFIVINHTIIQLSSKNNPTPNEHFDFFTSALIKICGNLLTLSSLEIRNLLRESSGFIGKDADSINEAALFHHQSQKSTFFNFIVDLWKSHVLSFVDYNTNKLETLNIEFWESYKKTHDIDNKLNVLKEDDTTYHNELAKLNMYYNSLHLTKDKNDIIKFGDIFLGIDQNGKHNGKYWLNITAHCDCILPKENIKNNFYFIAGNNKPIKDLLADGDGGFNSYLNFEDKIHSISWNPRLLILNINDNKMNNNNVIASDGMHSQINLKYIGTLKENYAQRMANNSFSFAMRVGIDFVTT